MISEGEFNDHKYAGKENLRHVSTRELDLLGTPTLSRH